MGLGLSPKSPNPAVKRGAEPQCWPGTAGEVFLPPTTSWEGGHGRELPNQVYQKPPQGIPQPSWRKGSVFMQNLQEQAESRRGTALVQEDITAGAKREIKSGYKDTGRAACGRTCCFSNGTTANESHFTIIFCPGLVPAEF